MNSHKSVAALCLILLLPALVAAQSTVSTAYWLRSEARLLTDPAVQRDLKLTADQTTRVETWSREVRTATTVVSRDAVPSRDELARTQQEMANSNRKKLDEILTADQRKRFRQIVLQDRRRASGLLAVIEESDVSTALQPTSDQQSRWNELRQNYARESIKLGTDRDATSERERLLQDVNEKAVALLTPEQQSRFKDFLGEPFQGESRTARGFTARDARGGGRYQVGTRTLDGLFATYLPQKAVQDDLKLTAEQTAKLTDLTKQTSVLSPAAAQDLLTPQQLIRYRQIVMQNSQKTAGTIALLQYRDVVDLLKLTDDQKIAAGRIGEEFYNQRSRGFDRTEPAGRTASTDAKKVAEEQLSALLTADQQAKLKEWLGTPFTGTLESPFPGRGSSSREPTRISLSMTVVSFVTDKAVQDDLKLSTEQAQKVADMARTQQRILVRSMEPILSDTQNKRLKQLQLQYVRKRVGDATLMRYQEVADPLQFSEDQQRRLNDLVNESFRLSFNRSREDASEEAKAEQEASRKALDTKVQEILTPDQKDRLNSILGESFKGKFPEPTPAPRTPSRTRGQPQPSGTSN